MCRTRWVAWSLCCVTMLVGLRCTDAAKDDGSAGRGGSSATGGSSGAAGRDAGVDAGTLDDREAGAGGSGGQVAAGAGGEGQGGQSADEGDSGVPDTGGGGTGGGSHTSGGSTGGDAAYDQCLRDAMSAGQAVDDCTHCLCQADKCQAELNLATHDAKANSVVICGEQKMCTDLCCLCGDSACNLSNYATGPCAAEVERAAGVTPGRGVLANGSTVSSKCARDATDDNSCRRVAVLAKCSLDKCAAACPVATTCQ